MSETPATLKLVALVVASEAAVAEVRGELEELAGDDEVKSMGGGASVVHTVLTTAELRDRIQAKVGAGDSVIVVEFETWSGYGPGVDGVWLMRRGH